MNNNKFFYVIFSFCFSFLLAEDDNNSNGVASSNSSIFPSDMSSDKKEGLFSVTTELLDKNFVITIRPYKVDEGNQVVSLKKTLENAMGEKYTFPFIPESFFGVVKFLGALDLVKKIYHKINFHIGLQLGNCDISDNNIVIRFPLISELLLQEAKKSSLPKAEKWYDDEGGEVGSSFFEKYSNIIPNDPLDNCD